MEHDKEICYRAIFERIEVTMKFDEHWNELTKIKIKTSKLKLYETN